MRQKTRIFIYILIAVAAVIMGTLAILENHQADSTVSAQEHIDLGRIYLTELSYEKAVLEFTEAIEIEPLNADAYLGLAEVYVGMGDTEKAAEVLEEGYGKTGDERLGDMLEELLPPVVEEITSVITAAEIITTTEETTTVSIEERVIVPDLLGLTEEEAIVACESVGLEYSVSYDYSDDVEKGYVLSQIIPVDASVAEGICVPFVISKGKESIVVSETSVSTSADTISETTVTASVKTETTITETEPESVEEFITIKDRKYSTSLTRLDLSRKDLSNDDIKQLSKMINLTYLNLNGNQITNIDVLSNLENLTELLLCNNQISDISILSNLTNLTKLNISINNITDINALSSLTNLTDLDIWNNEISDISPLSNLKSLTTLSINKNEIEDISCLSSLKNLKYLHLGDNDITNIDAIAELTNLKALTGLDSIDITADDVHKIRRALPNCITDGDWKITFSNLN